MESPPLTPQRTQELTRLAESLDEKLRAAGAVSAERAFGLGCSMGILPTLAIILILFALRIIDLILAIILVIMAGLALAGIATLIAIQARSNATRREYQTHVEAEIAQYLSAHHMTRLEFDTRLHPLLPSTAPLQSYLSPALPEREDVPARSG